VTGSGFGDGHEHVEFQGDGGANGLSATQEIIGDVATKMRYSNSAVHINSVVHVWGTVLLLRFSRALLSRIERTGQALYEKTTVREKR
jgi:hypothetical protein